jgi:DNA-binding response OmpR family regulator
MSDTTPDSPISIADVAFDRQERVIVAANRRTALDHRSGEIFAALAARPNICVDKETLLRAAWPSQIVHENSLAKAISRLRSALEGSRLEIVASYGIGYTLREVGDSRSAIDQPNDIQPPAETAGQAVNRRRVPIGVAVALLAASPFVGAVAWWKSSVPLRETPPITNDAPNAIATILWVDDHPVNNRLEVELFKERGIAVHLAENTADALKLLTMNRYDLVISDLGRGEDRLAGLKMTQSMKQAGSKVPVIIYTVRPKEPSGQAAQRRLAAEAGVADLAVTPEEVRAKVIQRLAP